MSRFSLSKTRSMLSDSDRQLYHKLHDAGKFDEAKELVLWHIENAGKNGLPIRKPEDDAIKVIMEIGNRMREYACTEVEAAKIRGYEVQQLDFNERMKARPSLNQTIRTHPDLKQDKYWTLAEIGELVGMAVNTMSNKKILGTALHVEGFDRKRRGGKYYWYRKQVVL